MGNVFNPTRPNWGYDIFHVSCFKKTQHQTIIAPTSKNLSISTLEREKP